MHSASTVTTRPVRSTVSYVLLISSVNARTVVPAAAVPVVASRRNRPEGPLDERERPVEANRLAGSENEVCIRGTCTRHVLQVHWRAPIRPARLVMARGCIMAVVMLLAGSAQAQNHNKKRRQISENRPASDHPLSLSVMSFRVASWVVVVAVRDGRGEKASVLMMRQFNNFFPPAGAP